MSYEFTKLSEVEFAEQPSTEANILIEDNGDIKKTLLSNISGSGSGSGVEVFDFDPSGMYGMIVETDLVKEAFSKNMTFHVIFQTDMHEDGDRLNLTHVSFPRIQDCCQIDSQMPAGPSVSTKVQVWSLSEEAFIPVTISFLFATNPDTNDIEASGLLIDLAMDFDIKACYATTV